jgi:hypothetical protein
VALRDVPLDANVPGLERGFGEFVWEGCPDSRRFLSKTIIVFVSHS